MAKDAAAPVLRLVHKTRTRARLRLDAACTAGEAQALADAVMQVPGLARAQVRPSTGSVILEAEHGIDPPLEALEARSIVRIAQPLKAPPVAQTLQLGLLRGDMAVRQGTGEALDLRTAMVLLLIAGAIVQVLRGRVAGPATTLFFTALSLMDRGGKR